MSLYLKLVLAEIGDLQQACSHSVIPRCVCVSLVMVWRIMSPVYCVTQISFYRSAHSRRNTHITPHTYHPVLLLLTLIDTLSSPHTYSPLTCFSFSNLKGKKATKKAFLKFPHTHSLLCAKITLFFFLCPLDTWGLNLNLVFVCLSSWNWCKTLELLLFSNIFL